MPAHTMPCAERASERARERDEGELRGVWRTGAVEVRGALTVGRRVADALARRRHRIGPGGSLRELALEVVVVVVQAIVLVGEGGGGGSWGGGEEPFGAWTYHHIDYDSISSIPAFPGRDDVGALGPEVPLLPHVETRVRDKVRCA
jgi:hypothetical protein